MIFVCACSFSIYIRIQSSENDDDDNNNVDLIKQPCRSHSKATYSETKIKYT